MLETSLMPSRHDPGTVVVSILIAIFACYVALDLARRVRGRDRASALAWGVGGALVMGTGVWATHFVGMLAFRLPITLGFLPDITFMSWLAAVAASALALAIASRERLTAASLGGGTLAMAGAFCAMHYGGMAAIDLMPGIVWNRALVAASVAIAIVASAATLLIFFGMRRLRGISLRLAQVGAALVMGMAIDGMHYTGMAAAGFPEGAVCLSADRLGGPSLGSMVMVAAALLLSITLFTSVVDARLETRAVRLAASLETTNQQLQHANDELRRLAFSDALTGLPNLARFDDRLEHALARARGQPDARLAVLFVDLDGFKTVNDGLGHAAGDALLRMTADRLLAQCRDADTLARVGGDEFIVLLEDLADAAQAAGAAERITRALARPFQLDRRDVRIGASVGLALCPDHGEGTRLKAMADAAMHAAKRAGGNRVEVFDAARHDLGAGALDMLQDLRVALEQGQLSLHYQPKIDAVGGHMYGVEALLRWQHPQRGMVSPGEFIPLAERNGLIVPIGNWVLDEACRQMAAWAVEGRHLMVAVNLSAWQVRQPDFVQRVRATLARHAADPRLLVCEFTESVAMEDVFATQRVIEQLQALGVQLSIDDFGTGHSTLAMLRHLRVHELKIDRLFVRDVAQDPKARNLLEAMVRMAHALGMVVVAEGVETQAQRDTLVALGCDALQGFFYARPMPAAQLADQALKGSAARRTLPAALSA